MQISIFMSDNLHFTAYFPFLFFLIFLFILLNVVVVVVFFLLNVHDTYVLFWLRWISSTPKALFFNDFFFIFSLLINSHICSFRLCAFIPILLLFICSSRWRYQPPLPFPFSSVESVTDFLKQVNMSTNNVFTARKKRETTNNAGEQNHSTHVRVCVASITEFI